MQVLTLGFSPCPNDTFIFDAMVNGKIDTEGLQFEVLMEDVETLNQWALAGKLEVSKISFSTYLHVANQYHLLQCGSALGRGVGPLLLTTKAKAETITNLADFVQHATIAIPGEYTTANLLLSLAFPQATHKKNIVFSEIENAVLQGDVDAGLVIHESRFTYAQKGLHLLMDMGNYWETLTQCAIPLGGICTHRRLTNDTALKVQHVLRRSIDYAWQHYPKLSEYVTCHAQEMQPDVMRQHIELYVNSFTNDLGEEGKHAVATLFAQALGKDIISKVEGEIYL